MHLAKLNLLLESANEIISATPPNLDGWITQHAGARLPELEYIYRHKNGFLAFDRALRFFAADPHVHDLSLSRYKQVAPAERTQRSPQEVLTRLAELELEIQQGLSELTALLR